MFVVSVSTESSLVVEASSVTLCLDTILATSSVIDADPTLISLWLILLLPHHRTFMTAISALVATTMAATSVPVGPRLVLPPVLYAFAKSSKNHSAIHALVVMMMPIHARMGPCSREISTTIASSRNALLLHRLTTTATSALVVTTMAAIFALVGLRQDLVPVLARGDFAKLGLNLGVILVPSATMTPTHVRMGR